MTHFDSLLIGAELLLVPLAVLTYAAIAGDTVRRFIALQLGGVIAAVILTLLSIVFAQPQFVELAIAGSLLSIGGCFAYAHFLERWF